MKDATHVSFRIAALVCLLGACATVNGRHAQAGPQQTAKERSAAAVSEIRSLLELLGIEASELIAWARQTSSLDELNGEGLWRLLYAVRRLRTWDLERLALAPTQWSDNSADPDVYCGAATRVKGRVVHIDSHRLPGADATRLGFDRYYRCQFVTADSERTIWFYALDVPDEWSIGEAVDYRASGIGLFATAVNDPADRQVVVLVGQRIAWHPTTMLGELGVDVGLLDDVQDRSKIRAEEREAFYQILAACAGNDQGLLNRLAAREVSSVVPLFNEPASMRGKLVSLKGTAVSAVPVRVEAEDIRSRFGIQQYYEIAMFTDDSQQNPIVFCVVDLPEGMPSGADIFERIRVAGFFFKAWAYPRASGNRATRQIAPLLIGQSPNWQPPEQRSYAGLITGGAFIALLGGLCFMLWRQGRRDRRIFAERLASKQRAEVTAAGDLDLDLPDDAAAAGNR